jgi:hypothetical protein
VVGETVSNESELALLDVLLDGVKVLLLGDLHLGVGPSGNLDDHYGQQKISFPYSRTSV